MSPPRRKRKGNEAKLRQHISTNRPGRCSIFDATKVAHQRIGIRPTFRLVNGPQKPNSYRDQQSASEASNLRSRHEALRRSSSYAVQSKLSSAHATKIDPLADPLGGYWYR
jgi:hypothetical protein